VGLIMRVPKVRYPQTFALITKNTVLGIRIWSNFGWLDRKTVL
jgi:hypothetical protein